MCLNSSQLGYDRCEAIIMECAKSGSRCENENEMSKMKPAGILTALDMMNDGNDWIVDIDLEKFFDTVNHDKLMTINRQNY